jgi:hypothetical protein
VPLLRGLSFSCFHLIILIMKTLPVVTRLLVVFAGLLLLAGCGKGPTSGTTKVEGQVVQQQSRQPVGNGTVQVYRASSGGGYVPVGAARPCDAQGRFSFAFDAQGQDSYLLLADAPPGYFTDWADAPALTSGRKNTDLTVPVMAPAWVRLVLVDEPPKSSVTMFISGYTGSGTRLNYPRDTTLIRPCNADFARKIIWVIRDEKGSPSQFEQDINPAALDTVTVRIPF